MSAFDPSGHEAVNLGVLVRPSKLKPGQTRYFGLDDTAGNTQTSSEFS
jgi:hypothetical protein